MLSSIEFQRKYEAFLNKSGSFKTLVCKKVLYIDAAQALWSTNLSTVQGNVSISMQPYKKPRPRMKVSVIFVRLFTCKFQTTGTGRKAKTILVTILTTMN